MITGQLNSYRLRSYLRLSNLSTQYYRVTLTAKLRLWRQAWLWQAVAIGLEASSIMTIYLGSCHCGTVRFRVDAQVTELTTCDCSLCSKRNALMAKIPETALSILEGQDALTLYEWNTRRAKHYFCKRCGIYVFHRKRAAPDHFGINVFCLSGFDYATLPVRATEGARMTIVDPSPNSDWPGTHVRE